jgi:hypothetical protein
MRMAITTLHQLGAALDWTRELPSERLLELRFEDVLDDPGTALARLSRWLGVPARQPSGVAATPAILAAIDPERAARPKVTHPPDVEREIARMLAPLRRRLGYPAV